MNAREAISLCYDLATHSEVFGVTTRPFLAPSARLVHEELTQLMRAAGMHVRVDAAGNLRGVYEGLGPRRLLIASHLDTVPNAGAFDGVLGVVLGVALIQSLDGRKLPYSIEVAGFSEEEGVRFGVPFLGSRALAGSFDRELLDRTDAQGIRVIEAIRAFGLNPDELPEARIGDDVFGYLEFHIEQGPVLEGLNLPLAVVDAIAGQTRASVTFTGQAGHAGTTPMTMRRDALAGAAEWILAVENEAKATEGPVATVGQIQAQPGSANVIAGSASASLDVRHQHDKVRRRAVKSIATRARQIAHRRHLGMEWDTRLDQSAVEMDRKLTGVLESAIQAAGFPVHRMPSGAGHDAMILAAKVPTAMLFLRSPGGISHHPKEAVMRGDVEAALKVGRRFLEEAAEIALS